MTIQVPLNINKTQLDLLSQQNTDLYFGMAFHTKITLPASILNIAGLEQQIDNINFKIYEIHHIPYSNLVSETELLKRSDKIERLKKELKSVEAELTKNKKTLLDIQAPSLKITQNASHLAQLTTDINDPEIIKTILLNYEETMKPIHASSNIDDKIVMLSKLANQFLNTDGFIEQLSISPIVLSSKNIDTGNQQNQYLVFNHEQKAIRKNTRDQ